MGASASSAAVVGGAAVDMFALPLEQGALEKIVGETPVPREDAAYHTLLSTTPPLPQLTQPQVEAMNRAYGDTLAHNSLRSGNFRVLLHFVVHELPFSCRVAKMTPEELVAFAPGAAAADPVDGKPQSVDSHLHRTVNALFLVRQFVMRFVERQDECSLLAHFNSQPSAAKWTATTSSLVDVTAIQINSASPAKNAPEDSSDDLAFRFLDALLSVLIEFPPTNKTYDVHVEVVSTLLVLLSPVAFPRDHSKQAGDLRAQNPFLNMLMAAALPEGQKSYWAAAVVRRLLLNAIAQHPATGPRANSCAAKVALQRAQDTSLVAISEAVSLADETEQFSYLTLEGVGSIAASILRFPWSFVQYFTAQESTASPLADRSVLVLLVILQSCRDSDSPVTSNPFRSALCGLSDSKADTESSPDDDRRRSRRQVDAGGANSDDKLLELSYDELFAAIGRRAPYEASHLLLYTLLYSNPMVLDAAVSHEDMEQLLLPLLETLYHARSVEPSRLYMLVIVLLTFTQDPAFVRTAHTRRVVSSVPWYQEHYMLDVSLGSLLMVIFTRLIYRNITHFQDSFIHLNAFAALSNLARSAENLHAYAAQGVVGLIDVLAKREAKLVVQMARLEPTQREEREVLAQKRAAYVEFIRLLLGVVSACLKTKLLPRNPQLIYSLLHRADTLAALQQHPEFTAHVNNGPVWSTLARFQALVDTKMAPDDVLDVDSVLELIRAECVSLLAASSAASRSGGASASSDEDDTSYRYEEEADPEQFFVPYVWKLIHEQTPDFCWKDDKITLFVPSNSSRKADTEQVTVVTT